MTRQILINSNGAGRRFHDHPVSGDVLLSDHVLNAYSRAGGISGVLDQGYLSAIQSADYFAVNEEFSVQQPRHPGIGQAIYVPAGTGKSFPVQRDGD